MSVKKLFVSDRRESHEEGVLPATINIHINWKCNAKCVFCYRPAGPELSNQDRCRIIRMLADYTSSYNQPCRINIAGGEPTLDRFLLPLLDCIKSEGLLTSLITNGSVYMSSKRSILESHLGVLDLLGVSIDSVDRGVNQRIMRPHFDTAQWLELADTAHQSAVNLKINTTVCKFNEFEDFSLFIPKMNPYRWKIFQAFPVQGTVGTETSNVSDWQVTKSEFKSFIDRHMSVTPSPVCEDEEAMRGTYAMISPDGCFYDSTQGGYRKSDPILKVGVEAAFSQVAFSQERFESRGGVYKIVPVSE